MRIGFGGLLWTAMICFASPMMATGISFVTTGASIFGAFDRYDSVTGLSGQNSNCFSSTPPFPVVPCATLTSTPATNITGLTAASTALSGFSFDPQNGSSTGASALGKADLATGTVGANVLLLSCSPPNSLACAPGGNAYGEFQDMLAFTNTSGHAADITLSWTFDGTVTPTVLSENYDVLSLFCFGAGVTCAGNVNTLPHGPLSLSVFKSNDSDGTITNNMPLAGWVSTSVTPGGNSDSETFTGVYSVPAGTSTASLNAYLDLTCITVSCDFSHTGTLSIGSLPSGVSYTSASGALLTAAVPEPGTWWMLACGGLLTALRRRRIASRL
jgi:hypothetical protein